MLSEKRLPGLVDIQNIEYVGEGQSVKGMCCDTLRDYIRSGRIPEGTKLKEREVLSLLGITRIPSRDALMRLENEGLVISKSRGGT